MTSTIYKSTWLHLCIALLLTAVCFEGAARLMWPEVADDEAYWETAFVRLLNSGVRVEGSRLSEPIALGQQLSANASRTYRSPEYEHLAQSNALGFRTRDLRPRQSGEYRMLWVGDSMLFGIGVHRAEMASVVVEAKAAADGKLLRVYNYSITGQNTAQQLWVAREYIERVKPDHLVLGLFTANDIIPNAVVELTDEGVYRIDPQQYGRLKERMRNEFPPVLRSSSLFRYFALPIWVPRLRYQISLTTDVLQRTVALLEAFKRLARQHGCKLTVVIIQPRDAVEDGLIQMWSRSRRVSEALGTACEVNGIEALDLLSYMNGVDDRKGLFYPKDGHFNASGQRRVAEAVYKSLVMPSMASHTGAQ
jgi:lysophospholipase L1-like esterase